MVPGMPGISYIYKEIKISNDDDLLQQEIVYDFVYHYERVLDSSMF